MSGLKRAEAILEGLDEFQRKAATQISGPVRILAVAGAGKTRTITRRIAYACAIGAWQEDLTYAVTFSRKAAQEMRERLRGLGVTRVHVSTIHSLALQQLRELWTEFVEEPFPDLDTKTSRFIVPSVEEVVKLQSELTKREINDIRAEIDWSVVSLLTPEVYETIAVQENRPHPAGLSCAQMAQVIRAFERRKAHQRAFDFNDILLLLIHLLSVSEEARQTVHRSMRWITVDEYQDISPLQHRLISLWVAPEHNICVVGDPAQTIYSFNGATSYYLRHFGEEFAPLSADLRLDTDYRSTGSIISYANRVLSHSQHPDLYVTLKANKGAGAKVLMKTYATEKREAQEVAASIQALAQKGVSLDDIAVLSRINAQLPVIQQELDEKLIAYRSRHADRQGETKESFAKAIQKGVDSGAITSLNTPMVTLTTIHASKGLEWDYVFLIGSSDGIIPFGTENIEEERRLFYVALTRGKKNVEISYSRTKDEYSTYQREPSRFTQGG